MADSINIQYGRVPDSFHTPEGMHLIGFQRDLNPRELTIVEGSARIFLDMPEHAAFLTSIGRIINRIPDDGGEPYTEFKTVPIRPGTADRGFGLVFPLVKFIAINLNEKTPKDLKVAVDELPKQLSPTLSLFNSGMLPPSSPWWMEGVDTEAQLQTPVLPRQLPS